MFTEILRFNQVLNTKNAKGKRRLTSSNTEPPCLHLMRRTTQKALLASAL